ncbi:sensor histidine kinase, partial [Flavobacterium sp.]|uniref:sensor histidine kinase n=1 Tax=Flavobacterium sp. TaxID=239 RepID=UPI003751D392
SELYEFKKEYKKSLNYKEKYRQLNDSLFSVEKNKTLNEIQTKYEVSNKNLKIDLLTKDKKIQKNTIQFLSITGILLLLGASSIYFFYRYRLKLQLLISIKEEKIHKQEVVRLTQERELNKINGILDGQEIERNRLAQEIHDGIGASLAGIKLELSQLNTRLKNKNLDIIENKMSVAFSELRSISHNLSLNFLEEKKFDSLLEDLITNCKDRKEFDIELYVYPIEELNAISYTIKLHIYRILQELLSNISKHAKARHVSLSITKYDYALNIILEDDGIGYTKKHEKGIGLKNVRERVILLGGSIKIENNNGTTLIIDIPINE